MQDKFDMPPSSNPFRTDHSSMGHPDWNIPPHPDTAFYDSCLGSVERRLQVLPWLLLLPLPLLSPGQSFQLDSASSSYVPK